MAKAHIATLAYSPRYKAELNNQVFPYTRRNAKTPLTLEGSE